MSRQPPDTTVKQASLFEDPQSQFATIAEPQYQESAKRDNTPPHTDELARTIASATDTSVEHAREQIDRVLRPTWDSSLIELMSWGHAK